MDVRQLRIFLAVAEHKNFSKAASAVFLTQSGVSYQIASLEASLGVKLFHRGARTVSLTEAGAYCHTVVMKLLAEYDEMALKARMLGAEVAGKLTIGVTGGFEMNRLPAWVGGFIRHYPKVSVKLAHYWVDSISAAVENDEVDLGFTLLFEGERYHHLGCLPLFSDRIVVIMDPANPLASRESLKVADLEGQSFLHLDAQMKGFGRGLEWRQKLCKKRGFSINVVQTFPSFQTLFMAVEAGVGIALFGQQIVEGNAPHSVHCVPLEDDDCQFEYGVIWKKEIFNPNLTLFLQNIGVPLAP